VASGYPFTHKILGILKDFDLIPSALKLNIPLSADDGQIHRILTLEGCNIESIFRKKLFEWMGD
jgi:hypothetical protein